jgi:hypothetical protein
VSSLLTRPRGIACGACLGPWGTRVSELLAWCAAEPAIRPEPWRPPVVPGFIESQFNPLVRRAVEESLDGQDPEALAATGVVLGSAGGDSTTADVASRNLLRGRVRNPLLFYQSIPNSILGYVSRQLGLTGPLACVAGTAALHADLLEMADLWLERPEVRQVVVVDVELAANPRSETAAAGVAGGARPADDVAVALVVRAEPEAARVTLADVRRVPRGPEAPAPEAAIVDTWPALRGLLQVCAAIDRLAAAAQPASAVVVSPVSSDEDLAVRLSSP